VLNELCATQDLESGPMGGAEARRLRDALERVGAMASERPRASFSVKHLEQDIGKLLKVRRYGCLHRANECEHGPRAGRAAATVHLGRATRPRSLKAPLQEHDAQRGGVSPRRHMS